MKGVQVNWYLFKIDMLFFQKKNEINNEKNEG